MQQLIIFQELKSYTERRFLTIYYNEQDNWVYNNWAGYVTPENVKQGSLAVLEALRIYKVPYGLNDNRELLGRWDQSVNWIEQEWMPQAVEAGLRYYALVVDRETFAAASASAMLSREKGK